MNDPSAWSQKCYEGLQNFCYEENVHDKNQKQKKQIEFSFYWH